MLLTTGSVAGAGADISPDTEATPMLQGGRVQGRRTMSESATQCLVHDLPVNSNVEESWDNLKEV